MIDLNDPAYSSLTGQTVYNGSVGGVNYTLTAGSTDPGDDSTFFWGPSAYSAGDGLGVNTVGSGLVHQIEAPEYMEITFERLMWLERFSVADLYFNERGFYNETGTYSIDGGPWVQFEAPAVSSNGEHSFLVQQAVTSVRWSSLGYPGDGSNHEYSLVEIEVEIPEPSSYLMLGALLAVAGLAWWRKRMPAGQRV